MDRLRSILYLQSELNSSFIHTGHVYQNFKHIIASYYAHHLPLIIHHRSTGYFILQENSGRLF